MNVGTAIMSILKRRGFDRAILSREILRPLLVRVDDQVFPWLVEKAFPRKVTRTNGEIATYNH
jgi:hypothetical protein